MPVNGISVIVDFLILIFGAPLPHRSPESRLRLRRARAQDLADGRALFRQNGVRFSFWAWWCERILSGPEALRIIRRWL